jgi:pyruvate/2-oxoglutarate dehydrogenase complex dihydrolipoamide acyltransferase (E2) component
VTDVPFPAVSKEGPGSEGVISTWFVDDGDTVKEHQLIAEVQVDKVAAEVPAPAAGTIRVLVPEEAVVKQGDVIARIE